MEEKNRLEDKETSRLEAFSDGVFAVAITLLVLNIKPPPDNILIGGGLGFWKELGGQLPALLAFVTSFFTIGIMWINHHRLFNLIKRTDTGLLLFNLMLLLVIVFIPYPTALLAQQYALNPEVHDAALLYSGTNVILAICFNLLWRYASYHNRLLSKDTDTRAVAAISRQYLGGPLLYLIAFGLAFVSVPASILFLLLLALFFAIPPRPPRKPRSSDASTDLSED
jgi:TMEM175 potassium channel family protein